MAKAITSKTESLTIRVPIDLMAEMRAEAKAANVSVGSVFVGRVRAGDTLAAEIAALKKALDETGNPRVIKSTAALRRVLTTLSDSPPIDPKAAHPSGPVLADPIPQNIQGQATGYRPKGTWKADPVKK